MGPQLLFAVVVLRFVVRVALPLTLYHLQLLVVELWLFVVLVAVRYKLVALCETMRAVVLYVACVRLLAFVQTPVVLLAQSPVPLLSALR